MYAVELFFNKEANEYIKSIWKLLSDNNIDSSLIMTKGLEPHLTLAVYDEINEKEFLKKLKEFKEGFVPIRVKFNMIGAFITTGTCLIAPTMTEELLSIHKRYYKCLNEFNKTARDYYLPGKWTPHCSLGMKLNKEEIKKVFNFVSDIYKPFEALLCEIALYKIIVNDGIAINSIRLF